MKNVIKVLFSIPAILSVPTPADPPKPLTVAGPPEVPVDILLEGLAIHKDEGGCCVSCGYSYCPSLDNCVKPWETYCQEFDFPYNVLYKGSGIVLPPKNNNLIQ